MRDFTCADYCAWHEAFVLDSSGKPQRVNAYWSTNLGNGYHSIRFTHANGRHDEANISEGRLKTDGSFKAAS